MADLGPDELAEYELIRRKVRSMADYATAVEVEHGSTFSSESGPCVRHAHVHWLPNGEFVAEAIRHAISREPEKLREFLRIRELARPYILVRTPEDAFFYPVDDKLPSQFVRRVVCEHLGQEDWDWAVSPREQTIKDTIELWMNVHSPN